MPASSGVSIHNGLQHQNGNGTHSAIRIVDNEPHGMLYHFGLSTIETDFPALFGDLKFICTGGSAGRIANFANEFSGLADIPISQNLCKTDRFVMFKTGPVLWVNHGIGVPSLSIMLNELFTLLVHAGAYMDNGVEIIRIGTCGGIGVEPGTVIVSNGTLNGALEQKHVQWIGGREVKRDAFLDASLGNALFDVARNIDVPVERGVTFCADDFYEGQMRLDGFKPEHEYGQLEKAAFLKRLSELGVKNIEMESTGFAALTHRAKLKGAICCVVLVNRMKSDSIELDKLLYKEFENRPFKIVSNYIIGRIRGQQQQQDGNNSQ